MLGPPATPCLRGPEARVHIATVLTHGAVPLVLALFSPRGFLRRQSMLRVSWSFPGSIALGRMGVHKLLVPFLDQAACQELMGVSD